MKHKTKSKAAPAAWSIWHSPCGPFGKRHQHMAYTLNKPLITVSCHEDMTATDLVGRYLLDADGTYPPEEFPALCEAMVSQDADMVIGSRMTGGKSGMPIRRYIGNKFFAYLLSWIVGSAITDTASGQRVLKRKILAQIVR